MFKNSMFMNFWGILNVHKTETFENFTRIYLQFLNYIIEIPSPFLKDISLLWSCSTWILSYKLKQIVYYK